MQHQSVIYNFPFLFTELLYHHTGLTVITGRVLLFVNRLLLTRRNYSFSIIGKNFSLTFSPTFSQSSSVLSELPFSSQSVSFPTSILSPSTNQDYCSLRITFLWSWSGWYCFAHYLWWPSQLWTPPYRAWTPPSLAPWWSIRSSCQWYSDLTPGR